LIQPILTQGRWIRSGDQNVVTVNERFLDRYPHLKMGDPIQFKIDGKKTTWTVVGAFQFAGKSGGYLAYGAYDYVSKLTHTPFQSMYYRIAFNSSDHSLESQQNFGYILDDHLKSLGYRVMDIETGHSVLNSTSEGINMLTVFLLILSSLTAMVGSIGLMGTMSMNVLERTREIGIMRALGASDRAIMKLVIQEGLIIGGISWFLGSLLAFPMSKVLADLVSYALFSAPASFRYSTASFLIWLAAVMLLSVLASVIPAYNASRLTIREVLAYE
jgi:putative ABC transport system permease protein